MGIVLERFLERMPERPPVTVAALLEILMACMERAGEKVEWREAAATVARRLRHGRAVELMNIPSPQGQVEARRPFNEWQVLKELCTPGELQQINAEVPNRPPEQWARLKRGCTATEWAAVLRGGEEPSRLREMIIPLQRLTDGWNWLTMAPARVRRRLAREYAPGLPLPVQRLLCASAPALRKLSALEGGAA